MVYATSDIKEVMTAADRILVMSAGRITGDFSGRDQRSRSGRRLTEGLRHLTDEDRKHAS